VSKSFLLVVSLGTQLRCLKGAEIIKSPAWTTTFIPVAGLDTCKWYLMRWNNYPAPSAAQLFTMLLHRKHFCFYFHYIDYKSKINATISQKMLNNCDIIIAYTAGMPEDQIRATAGHSDSTMTRYYNKTNNSTLSKELQTRILG